MEKKYYFKHRQSNQIEEPQSLRDIKKMETKEIQLYVGSKGWFWLDDFNENISNNNKNPYK
jgi:hypothetical protein